MTHHVCANTAGLHASAAMGPVITWRSTAVTTGFVKGHRAPVTTNNRRIHRDTHHRCTPMCKRPNLPPVSRSSPASSKLYTARARCIFWGGAFTTGQEKKTRACLSQAPTKREVCASLPAALLPVDISGCQLQGHLAAPPTGGGGPVPWPNSKPLCLRAFALWPSGSRVSQQLCSVLPLVLDDAALRLLSRSSQPTASSLGAMDPHRRTIALGLLFAGKTYFGYIFFWWRRALLSVYPPAVAWAVRSGRCWLRARCRCAASASASANFYTHWLCLIAVRKALLLPGPLLCSS
jgi:hypothetical protein